MEESGVETQETKTKKLTKKQIIGIIAVVLCAAFAVAGLVTVFVLNFSKVIPSKLKFIDADGKFYFQAVMNDNYAGYKFKFVSQEDDSVIEYTSQSALLDVSDVTSLKVGQTYQVNVCYKGEVDGGNSEYSEPIVWQYYKYLDTPSLKVRGTSIVWDAIDGADYYMVYVSSSQVDSVRVTQNRVDYALLPMGRRNVMVVACSNQPYLKKSLSAGTLNAPVSITHTLLPFSSATLKGTVLEISARQEVNMVQIRIGDKLYLVQDFKKLESGYMYQKDISSILSSGQKVEVRPYSDSEFLIFDTSQENSGFTEVTISA